MCKWWWIGLLCSVQLQAQSWIADFRQADEARANGLYKEAVALYSRVIAATPDPTARMDCLNSRAGCYKQLADYRQALADYGQAEALADTPELKNRILFNKTGVLLQTGRYEEVVDLLAGMEFAEEQQEGKRLANLAVAYAYMGDWEQGIRLLEQVPEDRCGKETQATLLQNKGFIKWEMHDYRGAYEDLKKASLALQGERYYLTLANLAVVEAELKLYEEALCHIDSVLAWQGGQPSIGTGHPDYIISLRKKAEILLKKGEREEALRLFRSFYKAELDYVKRNFVGMTEQNRLDFWKKEKPLLSEIFSLGEACPEFLYDVALLRRHIALLDRKAVADRKSLDEFCRIDSRQVRKALRPKEVAVEFACYKDLLSADTMYIALVASRDRVRHVALGTRKDLHGHRVGKVTLDEAVCAGARYVDQIYEDTLLAQKIWQPIVKLMPAGTQTLYFAPDGLFQMLGIEYLSSEDLKGLEMRRLSSTAQIVPRQVGPGKKNGAEGVLVVGGLAYNECLPEPDTVSVSNRIAYDYVIRNYGRPMNFAYLKGAGMEADSISAILKTESIVTADEAWLKYRLGESRIAHLATHGYSLKVSLDEPLYFMRDSIQEDQSLLASGIALTGANVAGKMERAEDGLLSARELCDMDLTGTELVVLSACQTAQGVVSDEGPAGLVRGLKRAGVKTVIATLWSVDDKATALFMKALYENWKVKKQDLYVAFRQAREALRNYKITKKVVLQRKTLRRVVVDCSKDPIYPYRSPYYWAPFVLID